MDLFMLGKISFWAQLGAVFFVIVCILLIIVVLLQKGRGGGLSAAFGGAGGQSAFGSKTGDVFTWATIIVVGVFLIMAMVLTRTYVPFVEEGIRTPPSMVPTGGAPGSGVPAAGGPVGGAVPGSPAGGAGEPIPSGAAAGEAAGGNATRTIPPATDTPEGTDNTDRSENQ